MNDAVGFLELNSIARGVEATDILLKTADVRLVFAKASCPGKYYILFTGEVAAVRSSMEAGVAKGGENVVDTCVIPNIHPQVVKAVNMTAYPEVMEAVGVMEFYSVTASVYSAADVELVDVRLGTGIGGKSFVVLTGDVAAVRSAVDAGIHTPNAEGMLISHVVIPHPHPELIQSLY